MARTMNARRSTWGAAARLVVPALGCGCRRAPSVDVLGSFFPAWMVCLVVALLVTAGCRALLVRANLEKDVGPLVLFYPCLALLVACLIWLIVY